MKKYKVKILSFAYKDIKNAKKFYNEKSKFLGRYFVDSIISDIDSLSFFAGMHYKSDGFFRMLAKKFPYSIYYDIENNTVIVYAILAQRANPLTSKDILTNRQNS